MLALRRSARVIVSLWVIVTGALLLAGISWLVLSAPDLYAQGASTIATAAGGLADAVTEGQLLAVASGGLQIVLRAIPLLGVALILGRTGHRLVRGAGRVVQRSLGRSSAE